MTETWVLASITVLLLGCALFAWLFACSYIRYAKARFRFYALRDKCVGLAADGVMDETDCVFEFFYSLSNELAYDAKCLNFKAFVENATRAILADSDSQEQQEERRRREKVEELTRAVMQRPREFQDVVLHFYVAIKLTILESSTLLKLAELCRQSRLLCPLGNAMIAARITTAAWPQLYRYLRKVSASTSTRRQAMQVYKGADDLGRALQGS